METSVKHKPIFIVGCTRSGTKLASRVIGGHPDNFLITEHREKFHIPEDRSGVCEEHVWWNNFVFKHWAKRGVPLVRTPVYNQEDLARVKELFLRLAGNKRLVIKNPQNILRLPLVKEMFPDALFIFCVRNPWHGLQSRILGGKAKYLIGSQANFTLPDDLLLKSIYSWKESIDIYQQERNEHWHVVQYEQMVFNTHDTIKELFDFLGMETDSEYFKKACAIPRDLKHRYYPVKKAFRKSRFKKEIMDIISNGCRMFSYEPSIDSVPGDAWHYYLLEKKIVDSKEIKERLKAIAKRLIKKIIRFIFLASGGGKKLRVSPLLFGALSLSASAVIVQDDGALKDSVARAGKGSRLNFTILQMQYQRLRHYNKVILMDSRGVPWILLTNIAFFPSLNYNYTLTGEVEHIKK